MTSKSNQRPKLFTNSLATIVLFNADSSVVRKSRRRVWATDNVYCKNVKVTVVFITASSLLSLSIYLFSDRNICRQMPCFPINAVLRIRRGERKRISSAIATLVSIKLVHHNLNDFTMDRPVAWRGVSRNQQICRQKIFLFEGAHRVFAFQSLVR